MLESFTDELIRVGRPALVKTASLMRPSGSQKLTERLVAGGALSGLGAHGFSKAKAGLTGEYGPEGTMGGALGKGAIGGLLAALGLRALGRMSRRRL